MAALMPVEKVTTRTLLGMTRFEKWSAGGQSHDTKDLRHTPRWVCPIYFQHGDCLSLEQGTCPYHIHATVISGESDLATAHWLAIQQQGGGGQRRHQAQDEIGSIGGVATTVGDYSALLKEEALPATVIGGTLSHLTGGTKFVALAPEALDQGGQLHTAQQVEFAHRAHTISDPTILMVSRDQDRWTLYAAHPPSRSLRYYSALKDDPSFRPNAPRKALECLGHRDAGQWVVARLDVGEEEQSKAASGLQMLTLVRCMAEDAQPTCGKVDLNTTKEMMTRCMTGLA
jgi:hypothetical protein